MHSMMTIAAPACWLDNCWDRDWGWYWDWDRTTCICHDCCWKTGNHMKTIIWFHGPLLGFGFFTVSKCSKWEGH